MCNVASAQIDIHILMVVAITGALASEEYLDAALVITLFIAASTCCAVLCCANTPSLRLSSVFVLMDVVQAWWRAS